MQYADTPNRRRILRTFSIGVGITAVLTSAEGPGFVENPRGGFRFLRGIAPYSSAVMPLEGFEIVHVTFGAPPPFVRGFEVIDRYLRDQGRPPQALCGVELRSPRPFTFAGFAEFNQGYQKMLIQRDLLVGGFNPVARSNVAPEIEPPSEVVMYGFSYAGSTPSLRPTFVVAGSGELTENRLDPRDIVARGDVSPDGLQRKAALVLGIMEQRLRVLGAEWSHVTAIDVYTIHDIFPLLRKLLLPRLGASAVHGLHWYFARPPIQEIEFEMDLRGCARELII
jgi:hypothetical protein